MTGEELQLLSAVSPGLFAGNAAMLTLSVQDVNEQPLFSSPSYSARIPSSVPYKYPVTTVQVQHSCAPHKDKSWHRAGFVPLHWRSLQSAPESRVCLKNKVQPKSFMLCHKSPFLIQATDPDSGDNGRLQYSLVGGQTNEFDINENTGQIFTVSVAGKAGMFYLQVQAADQGTRRLTAQTTVNVRKDFVYNPDLLLCQNRKQEGLILVMAKLQNYLTLSIGLSDALTFTY